MQKSIYPFYIGCVNNMNIIMDGVETKNTQTHTNVGRETTSYRTPEKPSKASNSGFTLDISGTVMDNSAYKGHGRTAEEVMLDAGQEDITARRNYMAVMSNSMSDEDFARLQKDGVHPGSTDIETVVTIVDHIKAALVKGGTQVVGYTDTISDEALKDITGSEAFAKELESQFAEHDIPMTNENVAAVMEAWDTLEKTGSLNEGGMKYMMENHLSPTPENFYTARYSASSQACRQGKGYYAAGDMTGYYAKKPDEIDYEKLLPQMEKVIEEAGYEISKENLEDAKWILEEGIPLNAETFALLQDIKNVQMPVTSQDFLKAASVAIADGKSPLAADLNKKETYYEQAATILEQTAALEEEAADLIVAKELPLTLRNLQAAHSDLAQKVKSEEIPSNIYGRRLLEEVRLSMTVEANLRLLRSGYQIETASLEELVEKLKGAEADYAKALTGEADEAKAHEKASLYKETLKTVEGIKTAPETILSAISKKDNLRDVYEASGNQKIAYEKAGQRYEELMTAPRKDMGDSIRKAFRNVDDILTDMEREATDENRRAVRILGYNNTPITEDNIEEVKSMDELLTGTIKELKPGRVLNMIREGVNPLTMPLEELQEYLQGQQDTAQEIESYSKFLYKLEKQKDISAEERSAYIGIYRLVRQVEKSDDAAVGAIWQTGAEFTLDNLLSAVRSSKHKAMDYSVDDSFGGMDAVDTGIESISAQIEKGFSAEQMVTKQELQEILENAGSSEAEEEFNKQVYEQVRVAVKSEKAMMQQLSDYNLPVTADNLMLAANATKDPKEIWKKLAPADEKEGLPEIIEGGNNIIEALEGKEEAQSAYETVCETIQQKISEESFADNQQAVDVKAMSTLFKQMTFLRKMAREENYEIPTQINGSLTSINLKIVHNEQAESKAAITMDSEVFGKVAAEFKVTSQGLTGFCICQKKDGTKALSGEKEVFENLLKETSLHEGGIQVGDIYFATSDDLDLAEFSAKTSKNRQDGTGAKVLYQVAKAFIGYVQETGMKKGTIAYEN